MRPLADLAAARASGQWPLVAVDAAGLLRLTRFPQSEPYWGRARRFRFDDPAGGFGVTYCAERLDVAFAETVLHEQGAFIDGRWVIDQTRIDERFVVRFASRGKPLRLADLTGAALKRLGLNNDLCACDDYTGSMQVSAAVQAQVPEADGIVYVSRQLNTHRAVALFERSGVACAPVPMALSAHPHLATLLEQFGVELLPSTAAPPRRG